MREGSAAQARAYRYVTLQGEMLEADGTVTVGTQRAEIGILSRKSELRELREQAVDLDARIAEAERDVATFREQASGMDKPSRGPEGRDRRSGGAGRRPALADHPASGTSGRPSRGGGA